MAYIPRPCPICRAPSDADHHPFCSAHCRQVDLGHWFRGDYAIPTPDRADDSPEDGAPEDEDGPAN